MGKTPLAVQWGHEFAESFPDGQLYANLRGFDPGGRVAQPAEAVRGFLEGLGALPDTIPLHFDGQVSMYRSLLAGKRILIVLDNARDADQIRPLLPGGPDAGALVVVTSRDQLTGLIASHGASPLALGLLTAAEGEELLARRLGNDRVQVRTNPRAPLAAVVYAAHGEYGAVRLLVGRDDQAALLNLPDRDSLERHLIEAFLRQAYGCRIDRARRYLTALTDLMGDRREFAWWRLHRTVRRTGGGRPVPRRVPLLLAGDGHCG